ncbi:MAG: glucokinase [Pseudomonadota bacterium]
MLHEANPHEFPVLVGDIGGTNARFRVLGRADDGQPAFEVTVKTADHATPMDAINAAVLPNVEQKPVSAILAAAGPITSNGVNLTNTHWEICPDDLVKNGPFHSLMLMNDFEAQALSLPYLNEDDLVSLSPRDTMADGTSGYASDAQSRNLTKAVLGPGTGLGVGLLVAASGAWVPVSGEGGHVDLGPRSDAERKIWDHLETIEGRISGEQILSGDGLRNAYAACARASGVQPATDDPAIISARALDGSDAIAVQALHLFCTCLGRIAGDLALTSMARGGVYIAGGIGQKIAPFLAQSGFRAAFEDKAPHTALMRSIPTYLVMHAMPALVGLSAYARNPADFVVSQSGRRWTKG